MRHLVLPLSLTFLSLTTPAWASSRAISLRDLDISSSQLTVAVAPGDGLVLDLSPVGQTVRTVAFGDASQFVISGLDGNFCAPSAKQSCSSSGATVLLLRRISGISLPTQTHAQDGGTTLTLITQGKAGQKILHLRVVPTAISDYTALVVTPNPVRLVSEVQPTQSSPMSDIAFTPGPAVFELAGKHLKPQLLSQSLTPGVYLLEGKP